jgi:DNA-binding CsgD family transcriptional regulator
MSEQSERVLGMNEIRSYIEWLSYHPTPDEITRALVLEHLTAFGACCARLGRLNADDSLTFIGEYGFEDGRKGKTFAGEEWRAWDHDAADIALGKNPNHWSHDKKLIMFQMRSRGAMQGHLVIRFSAPVVDTKRVEEVVLDYAIPTSLYLSLSQDGRQRSNSQGNSADIGAAQLTQRQLSILSGMVEGKTNHELATELGFSVSTIRHETMRIYQALAVSDRKEAAKKALTLSLI